MTTGWRCIHPLHTLSDRILWSITSILTSQDLKFLILKLHHTFSKWSWKSSPDLDLTSHKTSPDPDLISHILLAFPLVYQGHIWQAPSLLIARFQHSFSSYSPDPQQYLTFKTFFSASQGHTKLDNKLRQTDTVDSTPDTSTSCNLSTHPQEPQSASWDKAVTSTSLCPLS